MIQRHLEQQKKNMIHILTGSHLTSAESLSFLVMAAESAIKAFSDFPDTLITHHISVSGDNELIDASRRLLEALETSHFCILVYRKPQKTQIFDHMIGIARRHDFQEEDVLLFLANDDLLLRVPDEFKRLLDGRVDGLKGFQYIPLEERDDEQIMMENAVFLKGNVGDILDAMEKEPDTVASWIQTVDFSGYACRYHTLRSLFASETVEERKRNISASFRHLETMSASLGDLQIIKAIDSVGAVKPANPFVYHRISRMLHDEEWYRDMKNGLEITEMVISNLHRRNPDA